MAKKSQKFDAKAAIVGAVLAALLTSLFWYATVNNQASMFNFGPKLDAPLLQEMEPVMQDMETSTSTNFGGAESDGF